MTDHDVPLEILIHRAAAARADMRRTAAVADQANTAASDARKASDQAQSDVLIKVNALMDASDKEAADSHVAAARARAGAVHQTVDLADDFRGGTVHASAITKGSLVLPVDSPVLAGGNGAPIDKDAAFEAERGDTGGGACA